MIPLSPCRLVLLQMPQEVDLFLCCINVCSSSHVYESAQAAHLQDQLTGFMPSV